MLKAGSAISGRPFPVVPPRDPKKTVALHEPGLGPPGAGPACGMARCVMAAGGNYKGLWERACRRRGRGGLTQHLKRPIPVGAVAVDAASTTTYRCAWTMISGGSFIQG